MKLALFAIIAASLSVSLVAAAKKECQGPACKHNLDEMHAAEAFFAVFPEHSASDWNRILSEGPQKQNARELTPPELPPLPPLPPVTPKVGYYAIDIDEYGGAMEVKNRMSEECFLIDEGIGKDGWRFGITKGRSAFKCTLCLAQFHSYSHISALFNLPPFLQPI